MGLLHGDSALCSSLEPEIGEGTGVLHMQVTCPRPGRYPGGVSSRLFAARRGMDMTGQSMIGQNTTQGVEQVSGGLDVTSQDCTFGYVKTPWYRYGPWCCHHIRTS